MSTPLSLEESRELIKLCQSGRLYAIRDWISAGKSLRTAPETKKTVLSVAIKTGFHSLVELIAPHETLEAKNQGLADAVRQKRLDLVELLVACGAEIKAIPFTDVLRLGTTNYSIFHRQWSRYHHRIAVCRRIWRKNPDSPEAIPSVQAAISRTRKCITGTGRPSFAQVRLRW
jgi:hypothetical protein